MNKIVGRVADRSACNRKENRIKRALNGAIIHGNGGEGARRNAQSGLRGVVMTVPWNTRMCRGTVSEGGSPESGITAAGVSWFSLSLSRSLARSLVFFSRFFCLYELDAEFRCFAARRDENARVKTLPGFITRFDPLTLAYANASGAA